MSLLEKIFKESILEREFQKILLDPKITTVSFDIFDTLFFRTCGSHLQVFKNIGKNPEIYSFFDSEHAFSLYRQNAEKKAREITKNKEEIILADIYSQLPLSIDQQKNFSQIELEYEKTVLVLNPQIERWIHLAHQQGKKILLISDMYLSTKQIKYVCFKSFTYENLISNIFVSSEWGKRKATGNLFIDIQKKLSLNFDSWLHIGDNERSDVIIPNNFGIKTIHYDLDKETKESLNHESCYVKSPLTNGLHVRKLNTLLNPYTDNSLRFYYNLGSLFFAPAIWELSHWLEQIMKTHSISKLHFLMREGHTFNNYFKKIYPEIDTNLIFASRQSTFLPTLQENGKVNFTLFRAITVKELYSLYHLSITDKYIKMHKNILCKDAHTIKINGTNLLQYITKDLDSLQSDLDKNIKKQRKNLSKYLSKMKLNQSNALFDFGGGGTVIKRLQSFLPENMRPKLNILFYQHSQGYKNLLGEHTLSFLPNTPKSARAIEMISRSCEIFEILINGKEPTTTHYEKTVPNCYFPKNNKKQIKEISNAFNHGINNFFTLAEHFNLKQQTFSRETLALMLGRIIDLPTQQEVSYLGNLEYDEGRGSDHIYPIVDDIKLQNAKLIGIEKLHSDLLHAPMQNKYTFPWIQGIITKIDPLYLIGFHSNIHNPNQKLLINILEKLDNLSVKEIMIYGAGEIFIQLLPYLYERKITIEAVIDTRAETKPFKIESYHVISLDNALRNKSKATIVISSGVFINEIKQSIKTFSYKQNKNISYIDGNT